MSALRSIGVWLGGLAIHWAAPKSGCGEKWGRYSWLQLVGFAAIVVGGCTRFAVSQPRIALHEEYVVIHCPPLQRTANTAQNSLMQHSSLEGACIYADMTSPHWHRHCHHHHHHQPGLVAFSLGANKNNRARALSIKPTFALPTAPKRTFAINHDGE